MERGEEERELFTPIARDAAASTTCSNLAWCGSLRIGEIAGYMGRLHRLPDIELAATLIESRQQLDDYLAHLCRN